MKKLIYLKLGGSLVTDKKKAYTFQASQVKQIVQEVVEALQTDLDIQLVLGNGAGSFAHQSATKYQLKNGATSAEGKYGAAVTHQDATYLNHLISHLFHASSLPVFSLQPSAFIRATNRQTTHLDLSIFEDMVRQGIIPFIYGDVIIDSQVGATVYSTDRLFREIAQKHVSTSFAPQLIIHAGNYDGVLDQNNKIIPHITPHNFEEIKNNFYTSDTVDVTGGMQQKVAEMMQLAVKGIPSIIINGSKKGHIKNALIGAVSSGTYISTAKI
ncbi:isopentenyl phosphate kinase family protein [Candidatus Woesebacteria bacterium]|nr:isopentenyl phosphate kinase family protein [Candidatus Woesebacteria bacterium]